MTVYNIRTHTRGEFGLAVTVMEEFSGSNGLDEVDVNDFEGDDALVLAKAWITEKGGKLGEVT